MLQVKKILFTISVLPQQMAHYLTIGYIPIIRDWLSLVNKGNKVEVASLVPF